MQPRSNLRFTRRHPRHVATHRSEIRGQGHDSGAFEAVAAGNRSLTPETMWTWSSDVLTGDNRTVPRLMCPEWDRGLEEDTRADRAPLIRRVPYEVMIDLDMAGEEQSGSGERHRAALTLNVGHGGMLVLVDNPVHVGAPVILDVAILRHVCPTACPLAEVAWTHPVPFASRTLHFVGLKFLL